MTRASVIALCHGGGPMPLLGDPDHKEIVDSLSKKVPEILNLGTSKPPRAIVVVTAHWSEHVVSISSGAKHELYYDYSGFPQAMYKLRYDAPGEPVVAREVAKHLQDAGIRSTLNEKRGLPFDISARYMSAHTHRLGPWRFHSYAHRCPICFDSHRTSLRTGK